MIFVDNMTGQSHLYKKLPAKTHFLWYSYDYNSIMHHGSFDSSANGKPVVVKKNGKFLKPISAKKRLTYSDKMALKGYYNCDQ